MTQIQSPCILVCSIDMNTGYCFGCGRTRDEIAGWISYSHQDRANIMSSLDQRMTMVQRPERRETRRQQLARQRGEQLARVIALPDKS